MNYKVYTVVNGTTKEHLVPTIETGVYILCAIVEEHLRGEFDEVIDFSMVDMQYLDKDDEWCDVYMGESGTDLSEVIREHGYDPVKIISSGELADPTDIKKEV